MTDRELILAASKYRSGNDSCNSFYMGSLATAQLLRLLGGSLGKDGVESCLEKASDAQVAAAKEYAKPYIDTMLAHPVKRCPCCGQITGVER